MAVQNRSDVLHRFLRWISHPRSPLNSLPRNRFLPFSRCLSSQSLRYTLWLWFSSYTKALRSSKSFFSALYFSQVSWQAWWRDVQLRQQVIILLTPLFRHGFCNARKCFCSIFSAVGGKHTLVALIMLMCVRARRTPCRGRFYDVCRVQRRYTALPQ